MRTHQVSTRRSQPDHPARGVAAALLVFVVAACATVDTAIEAKPGVEFSLALGQTAVLNGAGYRLTFNRVTEDSRCPVDVVCVWAGNAKIELNITRSAGPADVRVASLTPPNSEVVSGNLKIRFVSLAPAPRSSERPESRPYVAQLIVLSQ